MKTYHERHQHLRVSTYVEELDPLLQHELLERRVSPNPHAVAELLQSMGERDEGLNITYRKDEISGSSGVCSRSVSDE